MMDEAEYIKSLTSEQKEIIDLSTEDWFPFYLIPAQVSPRGEPNPLLGEYGIELYEPYVLWLREWIAYNWLGFAIVNGKTHEVVDIESSLAQILIETGLFSSDVAFATLCFSMDQPTARRTGLGTYWGSPEGN